MADVKAWPGFAHEAVLLKLAPTIGATMALLLTMRSVLHTVLLRTDGVLAVPFA